MTLVHSIEPSARRETAEGNVSYRQSATEPKGRWARYLHQMRRELDWSQQQAFETLRDGLQLGPKSRASYVAIDMGKRQPTVGEQQFLVRYFGKSPDDFPDIQEPAEQADPLVAALRGQTAAISALVDQIGAAFAIIAAGGDAEHVRDAQVAIDAAREDPPAEPADDPPDEPVAFAPRRRPDGETRPRSRP